MILPELGIDGQQKLKQAKVLMIGAGGLGCPVLQYLVAGGVGTIGIVDDDVVGLSNLHRQILYSAQDIGKNKVLTAKEKLQILNPYIQINAYPIRLTADKADDLFAQYDIVVDGSDNFPTRYLINDACVKLNKPLVFGSIFKFDGQVSVFNYLDGPSYRDLFPEAPADGEVPNCAEIGVIGVLPGIIGTYMANEVIKVICGIGETLSGRLLCVDALDNSTSVFKFAKSITSADDTKTAFAIKPQVQADAVNEIERKEFDALLETGSDDICLVDVREPYEFEDFNIGGINIPLDELTDQLPAVVQGKSKIIFYCQTGQRSKQAVYLTKAITTIETFSLKGGIYNTVI